MSRVPPGWRQSLLPRPGLGRGYRPGPVLGRGWSGRPLGCLLWRECSNSLPVWQPGRGRHPRSLSPRAFQRLGGTSAAACWPPPFPCTRIAVRGCVWQYLSTRSVVVSSVSSGAFAVHFHHCLGSGAGVPDPPTRGGRFPGEVTHGRRKTETPQVRHRGQNAAMA